MELTDLAKRHILEGIIPATFGEPLEERIANLLIERINDVLALLPEQSAGADIDALIAADEFIHGHNGRMLSVPILVDDLFGVDVDKIYKDDSLDTVYTLEYNTLGIVTVDCKYDDDGNQSVDVVKISYSDEERKLLPHMITFGNHNDPLSINAAFSDSKLLGKRFPLEETRDVWNTVYRLFMQRPDNEAFVCFKISDFVRTIRRKTGEKILWMDKMERNRLSYPKILATMFSRTQRKKPTRILPNVGDAKFVGDVPPPEIVDLIANEFGFPPELKARLMSESKKTYAASEKLIKDVKESINKSDGKLTKERRAMEFVAIYEKRLSDLGVDPKLNSVKEMINEIKKFAKNDKSIESVRDIKWAIGQASSPMAEEIYDAKNYSKIVLSLSADFVENGERRTQWMSVPEEGTPKEENAVIQFLLNSEDGVVSTVILDRREDMTCDLQVITLSNMVVAPQEGKYSMG